MTLHTIVLSRCREQLHSMYQLSCSSGIQSGSGVGYPGEGVCFFVELQWLLSVLSSAPKKWSSKTSNKSNGITRLNQCCIGRGKKNLATIGKPHKSGRPLKACKYMHNRCYLNFPDAPQFLCFTFHAAIQYMVAFTHSSIWKAQAPFESIM